MATGLLQRLLDVSGELVAVVDCATGVLVDCNKTVCVNSGRTREELIGQRLLDLRITFPMQTEEQWAGLVARVAEAGRLTLDTELGRADGGTYPARWQLSIVEDDGRRFLLALGYRMSSARPVRAELEREAAWQKALFQMATQPAMGSGDLDAALAFIAAEGKRVFPCDLCSIWKTEGDRLVFLRDEESGPRPEVPAIDLMEYPWIHRAINAGLTYDIFDTCVTDAERKETRALLARYNVKAALGATIVVGGQFWGRVMFGSARERQWTADEHAFATEIATRASNAVLAQQRQQIEQELRSSRERYRNFIEMSAELMWRIEFDDPIDTRLAENIQAAAVIDSGFVADANDATALFFGLEKGSQLVGRRLSALLAPVDQARRTEMLSLVRNGYRVVNYETSHMVRGEQRWVLRNALGVVEDGKLVRLWGASRDITARRETELQLRASEDRYRAFVANSSEGIFRIEYPEPIPVDLPPEELVRRAWGVARMGECNMALARLRGVASPEELNGRLANEFRLPTPEALAQELEFVTNGFHLAGVERPTLVGTNAVRWFRYSLTGTVEDGKLVRVWGTVSDVTDRKHLEQELRALSARQADVLEQERTRIAREIHDELGQQLTALKFEAAALEAGKRAVVKGEMTQQVDAAIHALRRIANELRPAILDHVGLGAAVEWQVKEFARRTAILCHCEVEPDLTVRPDLATTAFRILQEALTNAARHSGAKRVDVTLGCTAEHLELTVQDDGRGMSTASPAAVTIGPPSLGLIGMRERALGAGGTLEIRSGSEEGTRIHARFPLFEAAAPRPALADPLGLDAASLADFPLGQQKYRKPN